MHFKTLITLFIKDVQQDEETDREIADKIADLSGQNENKEPNVLDRLLLERLNSNRDAFSREVSSEVESIMEIYDVNTEDPELLEFDDHTQEIREGYETGVMDCIRLPHGNIVDLHGHPLYGSEMPEVVSFSLHVWFVSRDETGLHSVQKPYHPG